MSETFVDNKYQGGYVGDLETLANHFQDGDSTNPLDEYDIEALISSQDNIDLIIENKLPLTEEAKFALNKILKFHDKDYVDTMLLPEGKQQAHILGKTWNEINNIDVVKPAVKRYLSGHVGGRVVVIPENEEELSIFLPLERFKKASTASVWADSKSKMR